MARLHANLPPRILVLLRVIPVNGIVMARPARLIGALRTGVSSLDVKTMIAAYVPIVVPLDVVHWLVLRASGTAWRGGESHLSLSGLPALALGGRMSGALPSSDFHLYLLLRGLVHPRLFLRVRVCAASNIVLMAVDIVGRGVCCTCTAM